MFLTYLGLPLVSIAPLARELLDALTASQLTWQEMLGSAIEAITTMPRPFVLIVDDAERRLARLPDHGTLDGYADSIRSMLDAAAVPDARLVEPLSTA